jgi:hypothetical protein
MEYDEKNMCDFFIFFINLLVHIYDMDTINSCVNDTFQFFYYVVHYMRLYTFAKDSGVKIFDAVSRKKKSSRQ